MFIMWGYDKTVESLGIVGHAYCYDCRCKMPWIIAREAEWLVLYEIRTLPFKSTYYFVCERCRDDVGLSSSEFKKVKKQMRRRGKIDGSKIHTSLQKRIEAQQLKDKTAAQITWLRGAIEAEERAQAFRDSSQ